jgi:hypothetical protein
MKWQLRATRYARMTESTLIRLGRLSADAWPLSASAKLAEFESFRPEIRCLVARPTESLRGYDNNP